MSRPAREPSVTSSTRPLTGVGGQSPGSAHWRSRGWQQIITESERVARSLYYESPPCRLGAARRVDRPRQRLVHITQLGAHDEPQGKESQRSALPENPLLQPQRGSIRRSAAKPVSRLWLGCRGNIASVVRGFPARACQPPVSLRRLIERIIFHRLLIAAKAGVLAQRASEAGW